MGKRHFSTDILSPGHFGTWTVCLQRRFGKETIWHMNFLAQNLFVTGTFHTWIFRHGDLSAEGHFGSGTFRLMDILAKWTFQHSNTFQHCAKMSAETSILLCMVPKFPNAKTSMCRNIHGDRISVCWNIHRAEKFPCRNVPVIKFPCRNVSCWNVRCQNKSKPYEWSVFQSSL